MNYLIGFIVGALALTQGMKDPKTAQKRDMPPYLVATRAGVEFETRDIRITPGFYFPEDTPHVWGEDRDGQLFLNSNRLEKTDMIKNAQRNKEIWGYFEGGRRYVPIGSLAAIVMTDSNTLSLETAATGEKFSLSSGNYTFQRWQIEFIDLDGHRHQYAFRDISIIILPVARR